MYSYEFSPTAILVCVSLLLLLTIYFWLRHNCYYWQRQGLAFIRPEPLFGNLRVLLQLRVSFGELFHQLYHHPAVSEQPLAGIHILTTPALLVRSPELIEAVLIKNFNQFLNRYEAADPYHDSMGALCLPLAKYNVWRESRRRISTFFTSGRLKHSIYSQILLIAEEFERHIQRRFVVSGEVTKCSVLIEVKELCALFTADVTAVLLYGMNANCLKDTAAPLKSLWKELLKPTAYKALQFFIIFFLPKLASLFKAKVFTSDYCAFMHRTVNDIIAEWRANAQPKKDRNLIELLLQFKEEFQNTKHFTNNPDFVASQAAIFFLAGFETSSSLIAFTLYELAKQPLLQNRLRVEIQQALALTAKEDQRISYESLNNLSYLSKVVAEALRLYPAAAFINRECTPAAGERACSLKPLFDFEIPAGMPVYISILGIHRDEKYWPNPLNFDPERFADENLKVHHPMTYIPFGGGPHSCVGSRLGVLQVKLGLIYILRQHSVQICSSTISEIRFDPTSFMLQAAEGIYLRFLKEK